MIASTSSIPSPERLRLPGVHPLELWNLPVKNERLGDFIGQDVFPNLLCQSIALLRQQKALTHSAQQAKQLALCRNISTVFVGGGNVDRQRLAQGFESQPYSLVFARTGAFVAEEGGLSYLSSIGLLGMVVDFGQTAIKIAFNNQRFIFHREPSQLPFMNPDKAAKQHQFRPALRSFLGTSLRQVLEQSGASATQAVLVALPCELDDEGVPGSCSYPGMAGDKKLLGDALCLAGISTQRLLAINDAELAALSARLDPRVDNKIDCLVITLGYGVGAALLRQD